RSVILAVTGTTTFTIHVKVGAAVADGTILDNSASVSSGGTTEGDTTNNDSNTTHTAVQARADLTISKAAPATAIAGASAGFDYTLTVTNNGPSTHTGNLSASDTLPTGTTFQTTGSSTECPALHDALPISRSVILAVTGTTTFTIHVKVGAA